MSKTEVLSKLTENGLIDKFSLDTTNYWQIAFDLFNAANKDNLRPSCGSCFRKVQKWLRQN